MPSPTEICNIALAHLGDIRINSIDGESTVEVKCRTYYDHARLELLSTIPWTFARARARLSNQAEPPPFDWEHQAALPGDLIRLLTVRAANNGVELQQTDPDIDRDIDRFEVSGGLLLSNEESVGILYIADLPTTAHYSAPFITALSRLLAHYLAPSVDGDARTAEFQRRIYEEVDRPRAQYLDAVQDQSNENHGLERELTRSQLIRRRQRGNTGTFRDQ